MCGIGGIIGKRSTSIAEKIIKKLDHRGPDSNGFWISEDNDYPITLCHTRLSILDLSKLGSQPFFSRDKRFVLVYNGEIYNFLEVKKVSKRINNQKEMIYSLNKYFSKNSNTKKIQKKLITIGHNILYKTYNEINLLIKNET